MGPELPGAPPAARPANESAQPLDVRTKMQRGLLGRHRATDRTPTSTRRPSPTVLVWLALWILAAIYFALFAVRFAGNIAAIDWISDYASGFTLPETLARSGSGGHTVISTTGAWLPLWFGLITAKLPLHRQVWEIMPTLLFFATAITISWSVAQLACRRAAVLAAFIVLVASPWALNFFMAAVAHNVVYPFTALLGAYLIWLAKDPDRRRATTIAVALLMGIALGVCVASDSLLLVTGVIPFTVTALLAAIRRNRDSRIVALSGVATVIFAIPIAILTSAVMHSAGYLTLAPPAKVSPVSQLSEHARLLFEGMRELSNGYLGHNWPGKLHNEIGIACDVVMLAALLTLLVFGLRSVVRFGLSGLRRRGADASGQLALGLHVTYWLSSAVAVCGAFVFSTTAGAHRHESYYATAIFSIAAVVPLLIRRGRIARWLIPVGACIFFVGSIVGLRRNYLQVTQPALSHYAGQITRLAEANHVKTGYAGYWDASSLTWNSHERVLVRPLIQCSNPSGAGICPFFLMRTPSWYVPKQRHTFLLVDPNELYVTTLPSGLGAPLARYTIGPIEMYVYPYDIASRLGPAPN